MDIMQLPARLVIHPIKVYSNGFLLKLNKTLKLRVCTGNNRIEQPYSLGAIHDTGTPHGTTMQLKTEVLS